MGAAILRGSLTEIPDMLVTEWSGICTIRSKTG
jgi:hypothetical protein